MAGTDVMPLPPDVRVSANLLADDFERVGKAISATQIASTANVTDVPGWSGQAAEAYVNEAKSLSTHTRDLAQKFAAPAQALRQWAEEVGVVITRTVPNLQERYDEAERFYQSGINSLNEEVAQGNASGNPPEQSEVNRRAQSLRQTRDWTQSDILIEYRTAMHKLDASASDAATVLRGTADSVVPTDIAAKGRTALAAHLFNDMPLVDGVNEWLWAQKSSAEAAELIRNVPASVEDIQRFANEYGEALENPFFANALAERVGPAEILQFATWLDNLKGQTGDANLDGAIERSVVALGSALVLSMGGVNLKDTAAQASFQAVSPGLMTSDGRPLGDLVTQRLGEFKTVGRTEFFATGDTVGPEYRNLGFGHYGYEYLSHLMGSAALDNPDLALGPDFFDGPNSVAMDIVAWDRETISSIGFYGERGDWRTLPGGESWGHRGTTDPLQSMYLLMDAPESLLTGTATDPILLQTEQSRLTAVQDFLNSETPFMIGPDTDLVDRVPPLAVDEKINMTRYLTGFRTTDMFTGTVDMGEAFGKVLAQAAAPPDPLPLGTPTGSAAYDAYAAAHERSAQIASNFLHGYQDGLDIDGSKNLYQGQDQFGMTHQALRSWAGVILAPHVEGIADSLNLAVGGLPNIDGSDFADGRSVIKFGSDFKDRLLDPRTGLFVDLAFDDPPIIEINGVQHYAWGRAPAVVNLDLAAQGGFQDALRHELSNGANLELLKTDTRKWASLMETLSAAPGGATTQAGAALDTQNQALQSLISKGVGAIPMGKLVPGEAANFVINQAKGIGLSPTLEYLLPTDNAALGVQEQVEGHRILETQIKESVYQVLSTDGYWDSPGTTNPGEYCADLPQANQFVDASGEVLRYDRMTPEQQGAFQRYLTHENGQRQVYYPYLHSLDDIINAARTERTEG